MTAINNVQQPNATGAAVGGLIGLGLLALLVGALSDR